MSHFKTEQFRIQDEGKGAGEIRVVKLDTGSGPQVKSFALPELSAQGKGEYRAVKSRYGSLAVTDADRPHKGTRDNHFAVNPLLRDPLAIEREEQRVIDVRVQQQVAAIREQAKNEGEKRGYQDGLKKGRDEAFEEFRGSATESLHSFESMVQKFEQLKNEVFKANERFLMDLVYRVARMVTLKELSADPDYVLRLSRELLERVGVRENVKIRIHSKDAQSIELLKAGLNQTFADLKNLNIEVSDEVGAGGCKIETPWSAMDASLETQLQGLQAALTGGIENPKP